MASSEQQPVKRRKVRDSSNVINAIAYAKDNGMNNINMSNCILLLRSSNSSSATMFEDGEDEEVKKVINLLITDPTSNFQQTPRDKEDCFKDSIDWESETVKQYVNKFIEIQNNDTKVKTEDKVTATFTNLITPEKQVNPRYIDTNFYQGQTALETQEYVPDSLFEGCEERSINGKFIALTELLDGVDYTALIADAGAGKTTSAKRFARLVSENQIPSLENIKLVRYVTIASLNPEKEYTAFDLFFTKGMGDKLTDGMKIYGRYWVKKHSHEILLVLDGMDQANWVLDKNIEKDISYDELASVPVVFRNVLRKNLFQNCKIVITSREQAMLKFPQDIRPKRTVALNGLTEEDQEYLIKQLAGERGEGILHHLRGAPFLMSLCRTSAFLVFSVAVFEDNLGNLPETMSEILIRVLAYFIFSENKRERSMGDQIFNKLKKLAFNGTSKKRVLFTCKDLQELGLNPAKVCDLVVTTPHKSMTKAFHLIDGRFNLFQEDSGRFNLFFCHQSIQEALTALYICDMPLGDFENFFSRELLQPDYSIVRRILCGVLLNPRMNDVEPFLEPSEDRKQKSKVVRNWLKNLASACKESSRWSKSYAVELCRLLQECGESANDIIREHLFPLKDNYEGFKTSNFFVFISSLWQLDELITNEVKVAAANSSELKLFADCLSKMRYVQVDKLVIAADRHLSFFWMLSNAVGTRRPKRERKCHSNDLHIKNITCCGNFCKSGFQYFRQMIRQFKIDEVLFNLRSPTSAELSKLKDNLTANEGIKINSLKIDTFGETEPEVFARIGEIIARCNIEELKLNEMTISINRDSVTSGCKRLIFNFGVCLPTSVLDHISLITKHCEIDEMSLSDWNLSDENLEKLKICLVRSGKLIRSLRFQDNKELDVASFQHLGEIIRQCKVEEVWMKWPNISDDKISALHTSLKGHNAKLKRIINAGSGNEFVSTLMLNENK